MRDPRGIRAKVLTQIKSPDDRDIGIPYRSLHLRIVGCVR